MAWIVVVLLFLWHVASMVHSHRRRLHQFNFILYMLLDDPTRSQQREALKKWLQQHDARDKTELFATARRALEAHIEDCSRTLNTVATHGLVWNSWQLSREEK